MGSQMKAFLKQNLSIVLLFALIFYFFIAALQGQMGFFRLLQVRAQIDASTKERDELVAERKSYENLTHRLSNDYLDLDLLDEQARKRLGLVRENEIIIR